MFVAVPRSRHIPAVQTERMLTKFYLVYERHPRPQWLTIGPPKQLERRLVRLHAQGHHCAGFCAVDSYCSRQLQPASRGKVEESCTLQNKGEDGILLFKASFGA